MRNFKIALTTLCIVTFLSACNQNKKSKPVSTTPTKSEQQQKTSTKEEILSFIDAAYSGNIKAVQNALNNGIKVDVINDEGSTALMLAAYNGHTNIVDLLISKGAVVNWTNNSNRTALMFASSGPFNQTVISLLNAEADPNIVDNIEQFTALMFAGAEGQLEVTKTLLKAGANKTLVDKDGDSAASFAMQNGHKAVAEFIENY